MTVQSHSDIYRPIGELMRMKFNEASIGDISSTLISEGDRPNLIKSKHKVSGKFPESYFSGRLTSLVLDIPGLVCYQILL